MFGVGAGRLVQAAWGMLLTTEPRVHGGVTSSSMQLVWSYRYLVNTGYISTSPWDTFWFCHPCQKDSSESNGVLMQYATQGKTGQIHVFQKLLYGSDWADGTSRQSD
jgi:hypothetical protein